MSPQQANAELPLGGRHETLRPLFLAAGEQFAGREAYVDGQRRLTFEQWLNESMHLAGRLADSGVRQGDVVAIWLTSSIEFAVALGAAVLLGAIPTGINPRLGAREVAAIARRATPRVWIAEEGLHLAELPETTIWINRSELIGQTQARKIAPLPSIDIEPDAPAVIVWTSGTTGVPKGAWYDHRNLESAVRLAGPMSKPFDRRLAPPVFAHAGYLAKIWEQCAFGMTLIVPPTPWKPAAALRLMTEEKVTVATGVPTQWEKLLQEPGIGEADLSNLRLCIAAAAPVSPALAKEMRRILRTDVVVRYAMTECPTICGTAPDDDLALLGDTVGHALPGIEVEIRDEAGRALPAGELGRIVVRAPCMMRGYWKAPAETNAAFAPDGWLVTGDLGRLDAAGRLSLAGRTGDMYIRGGYNIYPAEVESVLSEHPQVAQAVVIGIPARSIGEIGVAVIVPADGQAPPSLEDMRAWSRARLADYKAPDRLEIVDAFPLTPMMKIDRVALRRRLSPALS